MNIRNDNLYMTQVVKAITVLLRKYSIILQGLVCQVCLFTQEHNRTSAGKHFKTLTFTREK